MPKKPSPDLGLLPGNYRGVNQAFYTAAPADYFHRRLLNLVLVAGNREGLDALISQGVAYRGFAVGPRPAKGEPIASSDATAAQTGHTAAAPTPAVDSRIVPDGSDETAKAAEHFVSAEAELLAQHAGETLLRLYLAHEFRGTDKAPESPSLDVSRLRSFSDFKARVASRFGEESDPEDEGNLTAVARVFHATEVRENLGANAPTPEVWARSLRLIEGYLRAFAHQHLSRAALYNAAKHGLALTPTEMTVQLDDGALLKVEGPAIQYLEIREDDAGRPRWQHVTHWVRADRQMALTYRTSELIETLWETARYRYLASQRAAGYNLHLVTGPTYEELIFSGEQPDSGLVIEDMRWQLAYDDDPPAGGVGGAA